MQDNSRGEHKDTPSDTVNKIPRERKLETLDDDEGGPIGTISDAKQIVADAIRLRVVTVSQDQSRYAAEDVLARLKMGGTNLGRSDSARDRRERHCSLIAILRSRQHGMDRA